MRVSSDTAGDRKLPDGTPPDMEVFEGMGTSESKRKGPDTRTVVLGPETKKSRLEALVGYLYSEKVFTRTQHNMINLYWIMHWTQKIPTDLALS